jgi:hypothetical protein
MMHDTYILKKKKKNYISKFLWFKVNVTFFGHDSDLQYSSYINILLEPTFYLLSNGPKMSSLAQFLEAAS